MERTVHHLQMLNFDLVQWQNGTLDGPFKEKGEFVLYVGKIMQGYLMAGETDAGRGG